jgi:hypothetical protein
MPCLRFLSLKKILLLKEYVSKKAGILSHQKKGKSEKGSMS